MPDFVAGFGLIVLGVIDLVVVLVILARINAHPTRLASPPSYFLAFSLMHLTPCWMAFAWGGFRPRWALWCALGTSCAVALIPAIASSTTRKAVLSTRQAERRAR